MPLSIEDFAYGLALPALAAAALLWLSWRLLPREAARRYAATVAVVGGFQLGYCLLATRGLWPIVPDSHWHWLAYALLGTIAVAPIAESAGAAWVDRFLLFAAAAGVAACLLVPAWDDLQPARWIYLATWTGGVTVLTLLLQPIASRSSGPPFPFVLAVSALSGAILLALSGSLRFAQLAGVGFGASAGAALAAWLDRRAQPLSGIAFPVLLLLAGGMLVGRVHSFSDVPLVSYVLIPLAPLGCWASRFGPLSRMTGRKGALARTTLPLALCAASLLLAVVAES